MNLGVSKYVARKETANVARNMCITTPCKRLLPRLDKLESCHKPFGNIVDNCPSLIQMKLGKPADMPHLRERNSEHKHNQIRAVSISCWIRLHLTKQCPLYPEHLTVFFYRSYRQ